VFELLANAFRATETATEWQAQLESIDQDALAISAIVLGLAPLLYWRLTTWNISLAPRAMAKLAATNESARAQRKAMDAQLDPLLSALSAQAITPILLKGNYLATRVYAEPHVRQMNDIDLLIRPADLARTESALIGLGYIASHKSAERGAGVVKHTSTYRPPRADDPTPNPYLSAVTGRTIEPHTSLKESWYGLRADITQGVWDRSVAFQVNHHAARALATDDLMLHLGVHFTFHLIMGFPAMVQLLDLLFVTQKLSAEIHWDVVMARAKEKRVAPFIYTALQLAVRTLDAPIPDAVIEHLADASPSRVRQHAQKITLAEVATRTQRAPVNTFKERMQRGVQDRAEVARWTASPGDQWRVWRTLIDVAHTDTGELLAQRVRDAVLHPIRGQAKT
jgi:hypothetical protein